MEKTDIKELIAKVKIQTDLNDDEIKKELENNEYDYIKVIKNYYNITE